MVNGEASIRLWAIRRIVLMSIKSYRDPEVWRRGRALAQTAYLLTKNYPKAELFGMTSQIRRAATSIPANIAEGRGRHCPAEFIQFLRTANGSLKELETHLVISVDVNLSTEQEADPLLRECDTLGKQILALQRSLMRRRE